MSSKAVSRFAKKLVVLSTFAMLAGLTIVIASGYIFLLRLTIGPTLSPNSNSDSNTTLNGTLNDSENGNVTEVYLENPDGVQPLDLDSDSVYNTFFIVNDTNGQNQSVSSNGSTPFYFRDEWVKFRKSWGNSLSFVLASSGLVFLAGLLQFFAGAYTRVIAGRNPRKVLTHWTSRWVIINVIVLLLLVLCVLSNLAMESDVEMASLVATTIRQRHLPPPPKTDTSPYFVSEFDSSYITMGVETSTRMNNTTKSTDILNYLSIHMYSLIIVLDTCILFLVLVVTAIVHRKYGDDPQDDEEQTEEEDDDDLDIDQNSCKTNANANDLPKCARKNTNTLYR